MPTPQNAILVKMLDRLFASLISGPALNCRPHSSRQRVDLSHLSRLLDLPPEQILRLLFSQDRSAVITGRALRPKRLATKNEQPDPAIELSEEERRAARRWTDQSSLLSKLRTIAEDARTYEQDTGVHVLSLGFPLLSMPPGAGQKGKGFLSRRIVAPIAFIPVTLEVKNAATLSVDIACKGEGVDLVRPNIALLAWLEQQTGVRTPALFEDTAAEDPWREIRDLVAHVARSVNLPIPALFNEPALPETFHLDPAPKADDDTQGQILSGAVLGLYPMANEGLLRDMQAMTAGESLAGPVKSFLDVDVTLAPPDEHPEPAAGGQAKKRRAFADERLVAQADPCQSRAALMARRSAGLVIHGPPGTGKSQTITNIIGDHLARGQRVLMVCDKRTALDVVAHRLDYLGFGPLLALVHDPQRDQRDLYRKIRERLENLAEVRTSALAARDVEKADAELQRLHNDLSDYWSSLMSTPAAGASALSFHDLMGHWLTLPDTGLTLAQDCDAIPLEEGHAHERLLRELFDRGLTAHYAANPWAKNTHLPLRDFLARPADDFRATLAACVAAAQATQIAVDQAIPALGEGDLAAQGELRLDVAARLEKLAALDAPDLLARWSGAAEKPLKKALAALNTQTPFIDTFRAAGPLDQELWLAVKENLPTSAALTAQLGKLNEYLTIARTWYAFFCFKQKKLAREVLTPLGLAVKPDQADRAKNFLTALRARLVLRDLLAELAGEKASPAALPDDDTLDRHLSAHAETLALQLLLRAPEHRPLADLIDALLKEPARLPAVAAALRSSAARAQAIQHLEQTLSHSALFTPAFLAAFGTRVRRDPATALPETQALADALPSLENILRIRDGLAALPPALSAAADRLLAQSAPADPGIDTLQKSLLAAELSRRLRNDPTLQAMDGQRLKSTFDRYRFLDQQKRTLVRDATLHLWVTKQKERLLASTLTRISPLGADLRRRLTMRGERAMRLRQVIDVGGAIDGGDPLFDMCPVWMASPETVAQIFPRLPLFDVVIFDEASQCRLEEALPVLTRGKRVVVAGDPKQLPPTRFFESAVTASEDDEITGEQDLFEKQQAEVEDLLSAALNLSIENAYLDVHYRSRNADLIEFSNVQFYSHRLQAIPAHPGNATRFCPLTLYRADGTYEERSNQKEADTVCRIVKDLLKRAEPPSIGIACFNLVQRDLIIDTLDALSLEDPDFARRLAAARTRKGAGSFEGLFVKNLENVQGDERDHIIISTTYGPQADGRFYQRFGPLGRAGGGRRLNVLITRAREEVHLVTSIPAELYRALPPVPAGTTPGGAWLLYAYLQFAEQLAAHYAASDATPASADAVPYLPPTVTVHPRDFSLPSTFAESLARTLASQHALGSQVHWGNDGFCIDLALAHPHRPGDVTLGILCDSNRYLNAPDPVEWDLFRTAIHESQGWKLTRLWTPQFFRDPHLHLAAIAAQAAAHVAAEPKDPTPA